MAVELAPVRVRRLADRDVLLLSAAFLLIFAGFNGAQSYVTTFYTRIGRPGVGFSSLILIYVSFGIAGPLSAVVISRWGARRAMLLGAPAYSVFTLSVSTGWWPLIAVTSITLGISASLLWTGQGSYIIRAAGPAGRGAAAGLFATLVSLGSASGVLGFGLVAAAASFQAAFAAGSALPLLSILLLLRLGDLRSPAPGDPLRMMKAALSSRTAWRLGTIWGVMSFAMGLSIGVIPISVGRAVGAPYVGAVLALPYAMTIVLSWILGRLSDRGGRFTVLRASFPVALTGLLAMALASGGWMVVGGVILIATYSAMLGPITMAMVGDVATSRNLDQLTAFFRILTVVGTVCALALSAVIRGSAVYAVSMAAVAVVLVTVYPLLRGGTAPLRERLASEVC